MEIRNLRLVQPVDSSPQSSLSSNPVCPLGICDGLGLITREDDDGYSFSDTCQCAKDRDKLRFLGERFYKIKLEDIEPRNGRQAKLKAAIIEKPHAGIFLYGKGGQGKTHFLAAVYNYWESKAKRIKYLDDAMLKDELRNAELNSDYNFGIDLIKDHDCIFIDDVGKQAMSPFYKSALYRIFNEAYKHNRYLFITANDSLSVLGSDEYWGAHVARRVEDLCQLVEF